MSVELSREELVCIVKLALAGLYTPEELAHIQSCRGAVELITLEAQTGDDPATPLLTPSESQAASGEGLWLALPGIFKTKEEAREKTIACWCQMWSYVETAEKQEAA